MRSSLFWNVTRRRLLGIDFTGQSIESIVKGGAVPEDSAVPYKIEPRGCPETSISNCQSALRDIQEELRSVLHRGGRQIKHSLAMRSLRTILLSQSRFNVVVVYVTAKGLFFKRKLNFWSYLVLAVEIFST